MLVNLEKCVMGALVTAVTETVKDADLGILVWCFTQLAELNTEEKDMANNSPTADLVCDMAYKLQAMDSYDPLNNLSVQAFNLYLDATRSENSRTVSFKEYLRLRSILLWACTRVSLPAGELLKVCLPDEKYLRVAFQTYKLSSKFPTDADGSCLEPRVIRELQTWVEKLDSGWSRVKFRCIHPVILVEILEPLGIIPQSLYLSALKYQAVHAGEMNILKWCPPFQGCETEENGLVIRCVEDRHNEDCETEENGLVIRCVEDLPNEDCLLNMIMNHGLCEWEFLVETPCSNFYIGLQQPPSYTSPKSWALSHKGIIGENGRRYCKGFRQPGAKVRVHLDMNLRTCSFTINGEKFGDARKKYTLRFPSVHQAEFASS